MHELNDCDLEIFSAGRDKFSMLLDLVPTGNSSPSPRPTLPNRVGAATPGKRTAAIVDRPR
jgi:hypothetical protein